MIKKMMYRLGSIGILLIIILNANAQPRDAVGYEVQIAKIDSTKDYYLIYAQSELHKFKVISRIISIACKNVHIQEKYYLTLSRVDTFPIVRSNNLHMHINLGIGNSISLESDWGADLFFSDELYGLCYTLNQEEIEKYKQWEELNPIDSDTPYWLPDDREKFIRDRERRIEKKSNMNKSKK